MPGAWEQDFLLVMGRVFCIAMSIIYSIFAFMMVKQVKLMNKSFSTPLNFFFTVVAWVHFAVSLLAIILVFVVL